MAKQAVNQHKQMAMGQGANQAYSKGGSVGKAPTNKTPVTVVKAPTPPVRSKGKIADSDD